jgi:hypothetical protein
VKTFQSLASRVWLRNWIFVKIQHTHVEVGTGLRETENTKKEMENGSVESGAVKAELGGWAPGINDDAWS